jgi:hypothetical protein
MLYAADVIGGGLHDRVLVDTELRAHPMKERHAVNGS